MEEKSSPQTSDKAPFHVASGCVDVLQAPLVQAPLQQKSCVAQTLQYTVHETLKPTAATIGIFSNGLIY